MSRIVIQLPCGYGCWYSSPSIQDSPRFFVGWERLLAHEIKSHGGPSLSTRVVMRPCWRCEHHSQDENDPETLVSPDNPTGLCGPCRVYDRKIRKFAEAT